MQYQSGSARHSGGYDWLLFGVPMDKYGPTDEACQVYGCRATHATPEVYSDAGTTYRATVCEQHRSMFDSIGSMPRPARVEYARLCAMTARSGTVETDR